MKCVNVMRSRRIGRILASSRRLNFWEKHAPPFHVGLLLLLLLCQGALARVGSVDEDPLLQETRSLSPYLRIVKTAPDDTCRIVIYNFSFEHVSSRVYLQWFSSSDASREFQVSRTVAVEEIESFWSVGEPTFQIDHDKLHLTLDATHVYSLARARFHITLLTTGHYLIRTESPADAMPSPEGPRKWSR